MKKVNWKCYRLWIWPLFQFFLAFVLVLLVLFLNSSDGSGKYLNIISFFAQSAAVLLIIYDLNNKHAKLRGSSVLIYIKESFISWWSTFLKETDDVVESGGSINVRSGFPMFAVNSEANVINPRRNLDQRLDYLETKLASIESLINETNKKIVEVKTDTSNELLRVSESLRTYADKEAGQVMDKVISVNATGVAPTLWSIFLIIYAAVIDLIF